METAKKLNPPRLDYKKILIALMFGDKYAHTFPSIQRSSL